MTDPSAMERLKRELAAALDAESRRWRSAYWKIDFNRDSSRWWSWKARAQLFAEAKDVIVAAPLDPTIGEMEAKALLRQAMADHDDWGWGSNWPNDTHLRTMSMVRDFVREHLADSP